MSYIRDISVRGLFIDTQQSVKVGNVISMTFSLPGYEKPLKIDWKISRVTPKGAGILFTALSPYQAEMIGAIVEHMKPQCE